MKSGAKILIGTLVWVLSAFLTYSKEPLEQFNLANQHYMKQDYEKAIEIYEKLIATDHVSTEIYYNLGNAYYKTGNYASAILNYERALKLKPGDEDIEYNLRITNLNTIDKIEPVPKLFYEKWWEDFVNKGSVTNRSYTAAAFFWLALIVFGVYLFSEIVRVKKITFLTSGLLLLAGFFTLFLTWRQYDHLNDHRAAIIFSASSYVRSSPDDKSPNLFMLHAGTRIEIMDSLKGWKKIRIANGNVGWVREEDIEAI